MIDPGFFKELLQTRPEEVCRRALCQYDASIKSYLVETWIGVYCVDPGSAQIKPCNSSPSLDPGFELAVLFYLLRAKDLPLSGEWISEKDIPDGVTFFRGPHALPVHLVAERFGHDLEGLGKACEGLGGTPLDMADAAYSFRVLPRVPAAVLLWAADSEFEAEARMLFDRTISSHLPLDVIFGLSVEVCSRIAS